MAFPDTIEIKTLEAENSEYKGDLLSLYWALYVGGEEFREHLDTIIIKREIERQDGSYAQMISGDDKWRSYIESPE